MQIRKIARKREVKLDIKSPMTELKKAVINNSKNLAMRINRPLEEADRLILRQIEQASSEKPVGEFLSFLSNQIEKINEFVDRLKNLLGIEIEKPKIEYKIEEKVKSKGVVPEKEFYVAKEVESSIFKAKLVSMPRPSLILMNKNQNNQILVSNQIEENSTS